ncbi:hypothetical protein [Fuchsiella alkaliacetigena]|uniref:hypothetical protein n=1 Tax=Fuchsiella alkaliacetigena TaxID=957042 RepID=UPI00200B9DF8|nr:hypothetical protein [Fuchsiella alkaliacetigena]
MVKPAPIIGRYWLTRALPPKYSRKEVVNMNWLRIIEVLLAILQLLLEIIKKLL